MDRTHYVIDGGSLLQKIYVKVTSVACKIIMAVWKTSLLSLMEAA